MTFQPPGPPPGPQDPPGHPGQAGQPTERIPAPPPAPHPAAQQPEPEEDAGRRWLGDPLSVALAGVIVVALVLAGLLGGELYARHQGNTIVARAVSCVVQDSASVSFGLRPFLIQHFTHHYRDMRVQTAGNRIREAKGMKLDLRLDDVRINPTAESAGTLGAVLGCCVRHVAGRLWSGSQLRDLPARHVCRQAGVQLWALRGGGSGLPARRRFGHAGEG